MRHLSINLDGDFLSTKIPAHVITKKNSDFIYVKVDKIYQNLNFVVDCFCPLMVPAIGMFKEGKVNKDWCKSVAGLHAIRCTQEDSCPQDKM